MFRCPSKGDANLLISLSLFNIRISFHGNRLWFYHTVIKGVTGSLFLEFDWNFNGKDVLGHSEYLGKVKRIISNDIIHKITLFIPFLNFSRCCGKICIYL